MRKTLIAVALAGLALGAGPAMAADLGPLAAPTPFGVYNWGGWYAGLNLGYQSGHVTDFFLNPKGFAAGVQAGYNWQKDRFVFGGETDIQFSGASDEAGGWKFSNPWFGTLRARGGVAFNDVLMYLTAGLAYGGGRVDFGGMTETQTHVGWTAGGGIEVGFAPNWSAKAEYLYVDLSGRGYVLTGVSNGFESNVLRLGVNYRF